MKDLNKLAEEYCEKKDAEEGEAWSNDYEQLPIAMAEFAKSFHKHALKTLLDEWTDERIEDWYDLNHINSGPRTTIKSFRDELKKEIGQ